MKSKSKSCKIATLTIAILLVHVCAILSSCSGTYKRDKYDGPILKMTLQVDMTSTSTSMPADRVLNNALKVLSKRLDNIDIDYPKIEIEDTINGIISMELPAELIPENIAQLIAQRGKLGFYETYRNNELESNLKKAIDIGQTLEGFEQFKTMLSHSTWGYADLGYVNTLSDVEAVNAFMNSEAVKAVMPSDFMLCWSANPEMGYDDALDKDKYVYRAYALRTIDGDAAMDGDCITDTEVIEDDEYIEYQISITMDSEGGSDWYNLTKRNTGCEIAIVIDNGVYSAPRVNGPITGGRSSVTGNFTKEEAIALASILKSGDIGTDIRVISSETVNQK